MSTMICVNGQMIELTGKAEEAYEAERAAASVNTSPPAPSRDLHAEIDALTAKLARYEKTEAALILKGVITSKDVEALAAATR